MDRTDVPNDPSALSSAAKTQHLRDSRSVGRRRGVPVRRDSAVHHPPGLTLGWARQAWQRAAVPRYQGGGRPAWRRATSPRLDTQIRREAGTAVHRLGEPSAPSLASPADPVASGPVGRLLPEGAYW